MSELPKSQGRDEGETGKAIGAMFKALKTKRKTKNHRLWEHHMRLSSGIVRAYTGKINRLLNRYRARALKQLSSHGGTKSADKAATKSIIDFIFDAAQFGKELVLSINPVTQLALQTAGTQLMEEIGRKDDPWKMPPSKALEFIRGREQLVLGTGKTIRDQLNTALEAGFEAGETTDELEDRVRGVFNGLSKNESRRIAVTETACSFNFARHDAMKSAGIQYKAWLSSHGPTVREAHAEAEDQYEAEPIPIDEPFVVGGEELSFPCDPAGSPDNIINCQCRILAVAAPKEEES